MIFGETTSGRAPQSEATTQSTGGGKKDEPATLDKRKEFAEAITKPWSGLTADCLCVAIKDQSAAESSYALPRKDVDGKASNVEVFRGALRQQNTEKHVVAVWAGLAIPRQRRRISRDVCPLGVQVEDLSLIALRAVAFTKHEEQNSNHYEDESSLYREPVLLHPRSV